MKKWIAYCLQSMSDDISDSAKSVTGSVPTSIHRVAQHEEQVIKASGTVLAQATQAAQHFPKQSVVSALPNLTSCRQHKQLLTGNQSKAAAVDVT